MAIGFLETDNFKRNIIYFSVSLIALASLSSFYFVNNNGCKDYANHLKTCTAYKCKQRVMGFDSNLLGHTALILTREIVGLKKHEFFATETCNVIESDNINSQDKYNCSYSATVQESVATRAGYLFGSSPLPEGSNNRATFAVRTEEQKAECIKQP